MIKAEEFLDDMVGVLAKYGNEVPHSVSIMAHTFPEEELVKLMLVKDSRRSMHRQEGGTEALVFKLKLKNGAEVTLFA